MVKAFANRLVRVSVMMNWGKTYKVQFVSCFVSSLAYSVKIE